MGGGFLGGAVFGCALDTEVGEALVLQKLFEVWPRSHLALRVVPFSASLALNPLLPICELGVGVQVHLAAEVTELVLLEGLVASLAQEVDGAVTGVFPATPVVLEVDQGVLLAYFICALAVEFVVSKHFGVDQNSLKFLLAVRILAHRVTVHSDRSPKPGSAWLEKGEIGRPFSRSFILNLRR